MMEKIYLQIAGTTSSKKHYVPFVDECRLVAAHVCATANQGDGAADVKFGKKGASHTIFDASLKNVDGANTVTAEYNGDATEAEKNQVFDLDTPLEIDVNLQATSDLIICLVVDPFVIGARTGF